MKSSIKSFALAITLAATCALGVLADDHKTARFTVSDDSMINTTSVKRGEYKIRFYESTNKVEVVKDNEVILTTTGRVVDESRENENNALLTKTTEQGTMLTGVRFKGERRSVMFNEPMAAETHSQEEFLEFFEQ